MSSAPVRPEADKAVIADARLRISAAARDLFATQGYEQTTVDAIAERAGVGRRTFFRYFRSKDDAIFPDHARIEALTAEYLQALTDLPPLQALARGVRFVFRSYVDDPAVSVQRYRLTRSEPVLRDREIASVSRYTRLFGRYLRDRYGDGPGVSLWSEVVSAAFVAAHNQVLRDWLRSAGEVDPMPALDAAFVWVCARFEDGPAAISGPLDRAAAPPRSADTPGEPGDGEDVVVAVFRAGDPIDDVVQRISRSL